MSEVFRSCGAELAEDDCASLFGENSCRDHGKTTIRGLHTQFKYLCWLSPLRNDISWRIWAILLKLKLPFC